MENYVKLTNEHPEMIECFFAFSQTQFADGLKKNNIEAEKIFSAGNGLYGTREGIKKFFSFYEERRQKVIDTCIPQEVYDYEFNNHECEYLCDDTEAINIVLEYFGKEKAKLVKRKYALLVFE